MGAECPAGCEDCRRYNYLLSIWKDGAIDIVQKPADVVTMCVLLKAKQFNLIHHDGIIQSIRQNV